MKKLLIPLLLGVTGILCAQTKVTEHAKVDGQEILELKFDFADDITIETWDKNEIYVEVTVSINNGQFDHIFTLDKRVTSRAITIAMDEDMWEEVAIKNEDCSFHTEINYQVYLPKYMEVDAYSISGNFTFPNYPKGIRLKTISGDIDMSIASSAGVDLLAKTFSGEMYSNLDIQFRDGKDGLHQIVGMHFNGKLNDGGTPIELETVSGNIYLREG